jgi:hypothetical protein
LSSSETFSNILPVDDVPNGLEISRTKVFVLKIITTEKESENEEEEVADEEQEEEK